jgi:hypothetical protein
LKEKHEQEKSDMENELKTEISQIKKDLESSQVNKIRNIFLKEYKNLILKFI